MEPPLTLDKKQERRLLSFEKETTISSTCSTRDTKITLQEHVDNLKKRLRHEENVGKALERAFNRPLGSLPRLPPYLPPYTLELLAEVAVLEEEVVCLEEQVVNLRRQGLYDETLCCSSSNTISYDNHPNDGENQSHTSKKQVDSSSRPQFVTKVAPTWLKQPSTRIHCSEDIQSCRRSAKNNLNNQSQKQPHQRITTPVKVISTANRSTLDPFKIKVECRLVDQDIAQENSIWVIPEKIASQGEGSYPNKVSQDLLKCLSSIFFRMSTRKNRKLELERFSLSTQVASLEKILEIKFQDPYNISKEFGNRNIGPYKDMTIIEANSIDTNPNTNSLFLLQRLKILLRKLASVDVRGLTHDQKLAFWINIYNSCMMNAFLEHGIPESSHKVVSLMQKAMISVGGQSLNATTIEHFILRLPHRTKFETCSNDKMREQRTFGLESSEPLVTFALSCGSWSSPAVRVYTPSQVGQELEEAKKDYLQAAVGISSSNKLIIPKLLDWYLLDFAKDLESLIDWICQQLPCDLSNDAIRCLERRKNVPLSQSLQVMSYDFSFRYLLHE